MKLVSVFVRQEMRLRSALVGGDAIAVAPAASTGAMPCGGEFAVTCAFLSAYNCMQHIAQTVVLECVVLNAFSVENRDTGVK